MNKKFGLLAILMVIVLALTGCDAFRKSVVIQDSGPLVKKDYSVSSFTKILLKGGGIVKLVQGSTNALVIEAPQSVLDQIEAKVDSDKLVIDFKDNSIAFTTNRDITYTITFSTLDEFVLDGGAEIKADNLDLDQLKVTLNGGAKLDFINFKAKFLDLTINGGAGVTIAGIVTEQKVQISGAGAYMTSEMQSDIASVQLDGAGAAEVWVKNSLDAQLTGVGKISYWGNPEVKQSITGLGQLEHKGDK
ncbi:MAG TPA: head GIN domain-containing protein [Anaerolineaceae bacterium]|nr:head GIN domain-containing protein [Anaerolineaceae bacterium]